MSTPQLSNISIIESNLEDEHDASEVQETMLEVMDYLEGYIFSCGSIKLRVLLKSTSSKHVKVISGKSSQPGGHEVRELSI
jgi:hypothetical protein